MLVDGGNFWSCNALQNLWPKVSFILNKLKFEHIIMLVFWNLDKGYVPGITLKRFKVVVAVILPITRWWMEIRGFATMAAKTKDNDLKT